MLGRVIGELFEVRYLLYGTPIPGWFTMNKAVVILIIGILLALVSLLADTLGIGSGGMGWKQITGAVVGGIVAIIGGVLLSRSGTGVDSA